VYLFFPAFFTDVGDAYRLSRAGRLRTDLGGVYFNLVFLVPVLLSLMLRPSPVVEALVLLVQLGLVQQLLPLVRLDGYFVLGDLIGVPDLFGYVAPMLAGLVGRNRAQHSAHQARAARRALRRKVRWLVGAWVGVVVPALFGIVVFLALRATLIAHVAWREGRLEWAALLADARRVDVLDVGLNALSLALLVLPFVGTALLVGRGGARLALKGARALRRAPGGGAALPVG
jgi:putative peptide zinc metalloprotease protein